MTLGVQVKAVEAVIHHILMIQLQRYNDMQSSIQLYQVCQLSCISQNPPVFQLAKHRANITTIGLLKLSCISYISLCSNMHHLSS